MGNIALSTRFSHGAELTAAELAGQATGDPWSWTIDDVVAQLERAFDVREGGTAVRPALALVRRHRVSGAVLLECGADLRLLKDEFGVQALGNRHALAKYVEALRKRSPGYKNWAKR